jgi:hypothetical protein
MLCILARAAFPSSHLPPRFKRGTIRLSIKEIKPLKGRAVLLLAVAAFVLVVAIIMVVYLTPNIILIQEGKLYIIPVMYIFNSNEIYVLVHTRFNTRIRPAVRLLSVTLDNFHPGHL